MNDRLATLFVGCAFSNGVSSELNSCQLMSCRKANICYMPIFLTAMLTAPVVADPDLAESYHVIATIY